MRAAVWAVALTGCLSSDVVVCSDGTVCPARAICDEARGGCLTEEQFTACAGLDNGTACTIELPDDGVCDDSVCLFARCGDGYRRPSEVCDGALFAEIDNCRQLGFYDDVPLSCSERCELDQSVCTGFCGDGLLDAQHELCDGALPTSSCVDLGMGAGLLQCSENCGPQFDGCIPFGWTETGLPEVASDVHGTSATNVWVVGGAGMVQRFDGMAWSAIDVSACTTSLISQIFVLSPTEAFVVGGDGVSLITSAGCMKYPLDEALTTVWAASATDAYVGGSAGLWHLEQGAWVSVDSVQTDVLWGSGSSDVYAAAESGEVRHWDGLAWSSPAVIDDMTAVMEIWGTSADEVYVAGSTASGAVVKRKDGDAWVDELAQSPMFGAASFAIRGSTGGGRNYVLVADFTNAPRGVVISGTDGNWVPLGASGFGVPFVTSDGTVYVVQSTKAVLRFTGTALVTTPLPPLQASSIAAVSEDEAYAVTPRFFAAGDLWAWNGARWTQEQTGNSREVITVGGQVFAIISSRLQRRTGPSSWVEVANASNTTQLAGSSPTDLWIGGGTFQLQHWNGSTLTGYAPSIAVVYDIWAASPSFAVAVGRDESATLGAIAHWNGSTWSPVAIPQGLGTVTHVWGRGPGEVYAVATDSVAVTPIVLRYDGTTWTTLPIQPQASQIAALWSTGPDDLFAATERGLLRFDGSYWTPVDAGTTQPIGALAASGDVLYIGAHDGFNQLLRTRPW